MNKQNYCIIYPIAPSGDFHLLSFYALKRRRSIKGFRTLNEVEVTPNDVRIHETNYIENQ
jgi:hypothetical protein